VIGIGTAIIALLLMVVGPAFGLGAGFTLQEESLSAPVDNTESYTFNIDINKGTTTITTLPAGSADLFQADLEYYGDLLFEDSGGASRDIRLDTRFNFPFSGWTEATEWGVRFNPDVPLELRIDLNSGEIVTDLREQRLNSLSIDINSGSGDFDLPSSESPVRLGLELNSGEVQMTIPDSVEIERFAIDINSGSTTITTGEGVSGSADIELNSGSLTFDVAEDAPVRLEVIDRNDGSIDLPPDYELVSGSADEEGVWESPTAAGTESLITLRIDVNSGSVTVR
jgi:hypothetical protein